MTHLVCVISFSAVQAVAAEKQEVREGGEGGGGDKERRDIDKKEEGGDRKDEEVGGVSGSCNGQELRKRMLSVPGLSCHLVARSLWSLNNYFAGGPSVWCSPSDEAI